MSPDGSFEDYGPVPASDVFDYLCYHCDSVTLDRKTCSLKFRFSDLDFFNRQVKDFVSFRLSEPYIYFVNYFGEVALDLPLNSLLRHMMKSSGTRLGNCREYINNIKYLYYEKSKETRQEVLD